MQRAVPAAAARDRSRIRVQPRDGTFESGWAAGTSLSTDCETRRKPFSGGARTAYHDRMIGTRIGRYEILEQIGAGGMGVVYRALDTRLRRTVAIKFLPHDRSADPESRARFAQEALAASALDHPNICTIFEIDETPEGRTYIVMAHYEGETLEDRLVRGALPADQAIDVVAQVADGLACAHAAGIVHRDIKASNVFLTREGRVKILDFGIAKVMGATGPTRTGDAPGTPSSMAPEQFEGRNVDHRADLWALGVVLHEVLIGRRPFEGDIHALYHNILNREPDPFPATLDHGHALQAIRDRCLKKKPEERYEDAGAVARQLRALTRTRSIDVDETRRRARWPARMTLVVVPVVLLLAALPGVRDAVLGSSRTLRVAVLPPRVQSEDSLEVALASAAAQSAVLSSLANLRKVSAVDPAELGSTTTNVADAARLTAADEVMTVSLEPLGEEWTVTMRRVDERGAVKWADNFAAPREDSWALDAAIRAHLPRGFPRNRKEGKDSPEIDRKDYEEYLLLLQGAMPHEQKLERLRVLAQHTPRFADVHLLRGRSLMNQFVTERRPEQIAEAIAEGERARSIAPWDSRPLALLADCAFRAQDLAAAERWLGAMRAVEPGNAELLIREGRLAESRDDPERAHQLMVEACRRRASQANLMALADLEIRVGRVPEAREHLRQLMVRFPAQALPRSKLATLELAYGRPEAADSLYTALIREKPRMPYFTNRGVARMLLGRYDEAVRDFREALETKPDTWSTLLNLADCESLVGDHAASREHYRQVLNHVASPGSAAVWQEHLARAQALAHLGETKEATQAAKEGLRVAAENPEAFYQAAVVFAATGDRASTLRYGELAIEKGFEPRWFDLPWFDAVRPELEAAKARLSSKAISPKNS